MNATVYIETSIVSYLTARPTRVVLRQGHQELTKQWWQERRESFQLYTSQFVLDEAGSGDPSAAAERMAALAGIALLAIPLEAELLAERLLLERLLPAKARLDALHVAVATVNGVEYLLTWNCKHLANAVLWPKIEDTCHDAGFEPPIICTPYELME